MEEHEDDVRRGARGIALADEGGQNGQIDTTEIAENVSVDKTALGPDSDETEDKPELVDIWDELEKHVVHTTTVQ